MGTLLKKTLKISAIITAIVCNIDMFLFAVQPELFETLAKLFIALGNPITIGGANFASDIIGYAPHIFIYWFFIIYGLLFSINKTKTSSKKTVKALSIFLMILLIIAYLANSFIFLLAMSIGP